MFYYIVKSSYYCEEKEESRIYKKEVHQFISAARSKSIFSEALKKFAFINQPHYCHVMTQSYM